MYKYIYESVCVSVCSSSYNQPPFIKMIMRVYSEQSNPEKLKVIRTRIFKAILQKGKKTKEIFLLMYMYISICIMCSHSLAS